MLFAAMLTAAWGWWIQPSPYLCGKMPLSPAKLGYSREEFIKALSGDRQAQRDFLTFSQNQGLFIDFTPTQEGASLQSKKPTVFAQSYAAASICLALCQKGQLLAVPAHIKQKNPWNNPLLLDSIAYTTEEVDAELLYKIHPDRCIASHFSSPAAVERFSLQGLEALILPAPNHIEALETSILQTADFIEQKQEGQWLLTTFKQSLKWLKTELPTQELLEKNVLIIERYRQMSLPSHKQLYMKWLYPNDPVREGISSPWSTPIDYETLYNLKPKFIVLLCENIEATQKELLQDAKWQHFIEETGAKYTLVGLECINSPSQIFAIGLYDLVAALKNIIATDLSKSPTL